MKSIRLNLSLLAAICMVALVCTSGARADLAFYDDFETGTIGSNPTIPVLGNPWVTFGATDNNTVQANPLVNGADSSSKVMQTERAQGAPAGREFIDLTPAQVARVAAGELLTIEFQHYQPDPARPSIAILVYQNSLHNFSENLIDVEFLGNRALKYYNDSISNFLDTGLQGTSNWDNVKVVVDTIADKWSLSVNGGPPVVNLPFTSNGGFTTAASILIGPSTSPATGFTDNVRVYVGEIPEPASAALLLCSALALPMLRGVRAGSKIG